MNDRAPLRAAVVGDSVVWGQGVARDDAFARRALARIGQRLQRPVEVVHHTAHSGAKIRAAPGDAADFVERYPDLAERPEDVEDAAYTLFGEVPSAFPTIGHQLARVREDHGEVDAILLDGGANDVDFQSVLDPRGDVDYVTALDPELERHVYDGMRGLLRQACEEHPRAVVVVTGYYPGLSADSDPGDVEDMIEYGAQETLGDVVGWTAFHGYRLLAMLSPLPSVGGVVARSRSKAHYAHTRALYWLRRAVAECAAAEVAEGRGNRVLFAHPAFRDEHAVFGPHSLVHEGYRLSTVDDPMLPAREEHCPRSRQLDTMSQLVVELARAEPGPELGVLVTRLADALDGPRTLRDSLREAADDPEVLRSQAQRVALRRLVVEEASRVVGCRLASFFHPTGDGAARYADRIGLAWDRAGRPPPGSPLEGDDPEPERPGLAPGDEVHSVAVRLRTGSDSAETLVDDIELDLGTGRRWLLEHFPHESPLRATRHLRPGSQDLFTIDTLGELTVADIRYLELVRVERRHQQRPEPWRPTTVELELNGVSVHTEETRGRPLLADRRLVLGWPRTEEVRVPDLLGMRWADAAALVERRGLRADRGGSDFSEHPVGSVAHTRPAAGATVPRGSGVRLVSSHGPLPVPPDRRRVPDLVGLRLPKAVVTLTELGFGRDVEVADSPRPHDEVISLRPAPGTPVRAGSEVLLVVSSGRGTDSGGGTPGTPGKPGAPDGPGGGGVVPP